jgi:hypothetical protein
MFFRIDYILSRWERAYVADIQGNNIVMVNEQIIPVRKNGRREIVGVLNDFLPNVC